MQNIPAPTTTTSTHESYETGEQVTVWTTEWAVGAYILRKTEEPGYLHWGVSVADRDLPTIHDASPYSAKTPEFGVNWSAWGTQDSAEARTYAAFLMAAAEATDVFNEIVAAD